MGALLAAAAPGVAAAHTGSHESLADHPWDAWSLSPVQIAPLAAAVVLYLMRARRLGPRLSAWRRAAFLGGMAIAALSLVSPIDPVGEDGLLAVHMLQHALLGGIAPVLVVLGLTGPVLQPLLRYRWIRSLQALAHPVVALPLWAVTLVAWHVPAAYEFGIDNDAAHAFQHATFFLTTALLWAPVIEPLPAPAWFGTGPKIAYVAGLWFLGLAFVNVLWFSGTLFYDRYAETAPEWGVSPLQDQANAGSVFMVEHMLVVLGALAILAMRMSREGAVRQRLIEAGLDRESVRRAVRYGRAEALAERAGVSTKVRAGID
jgi:putative membrane protein